MTTNKGKPTKSELSLITEIFLREKIKNAYNIWTQESSGPRHDRNLAQEQAYRMVLEFIIQNKRS